MGDADNADYKESNIEIFDTVDEVKVTAIVLAAGCTAIYLSSL